MDPASRLLKTRPVHAAHEPLSQPIYQSSVFQMPSYTEAVLCEHENHPNAYYTRWGNPTVTHLENQLLAMYDYEASLIFPSGMSAITTTFLALVRAGDQVFASNRLYGDTLKFLIEELPRLGVTVTFFDVLNPEPMPKITTGKVYIYFETLSNPDLILADFTAIKTMATALNAITLCDATFTPPLNLAVSLSDYVDITIHSLTKYISGHFASCGGAVLCGATLAKQIWHTQSLYGACIDPHAAWLISQGIKTLNVRLKEQNASALIIAEYLEQKKLINYVNYPLLQSNPQLQLATRQLKGGGGVVAFSLQGDLNHAIKFIESTKLIGLFVSLGGVHSCIEHAESMSHSMVTNQHRTASSTDTTPDNLIRLSIGIESVTDIIADLESAFNKIYQRG